MARLTVNTIGVARGIVDAILTLQTALGRIIPGNSNLRASQALTSQVSDDLIAAYLKLEAVPATELPPEV
jgi:hypothetical protein